MFSQVFGWSEVAIYAKMQAGFTLQSMIFIYLFIETECRHASAKAQEAIDHLAIFLSKREDISQLGFELPTSSLRFGYLSTIIR